MANYKDYMCRCRARATQDYRYGITNMAMDKERSTIIIVLALLAVGEFSALSLYGHLYLAEFQELFEGFGAQKLPIITTFCLVSYGYWWIMAIVPALFLIQELWTGSFMILSGTNKVVFLLVLIGSGFVLLGLSIYAMYLPIFTLGGVS